MFKWIYVCSMNKQEIEPICKIEIIDLKKVKIAKNKLSNKSEILDISSIFKLIGEPTRLKILFSLSDNELFVCDLAASTDSAISAISH